MLIISQIIVFSCFSAVTLLRNGHVKLKDSFFPFLQEW